MKQYRILSGIVVLYVGILVYGCGDDKSTNSPPAVNNYELVLNSTYDPDADSARFLLVFNSSNDSVIDSSYIDYAFHGGMAFSTDGRILYRSRLGLIPFPEHVIWATDWETGDTVAIYEGIGGGNLAVDETNGYLLHWYPTLFTLPDLQLVFSDSGGGSSGAIFVPGEEQACYFASGETHVTMVDYGIMPAVTHEKSVYNMTGQPVNLDAIGVSNTGDSLFLIGSVDGQSEYLLVATADSVSTIAQFAIPPYFTYRCSPILPRPFSDDVLFYYPGSFGGIEGPGTSGILYRMDLESGQWSILLDESDYGFMFIRDLFITPDGRFAYVVRLPALIKVDLISGQKQQVLTDRLLGGHFITLRP